MGGGVGPTANFLFSPTSPKVGENVNFNASAVCPLLDARSHLRVDWRRRAEELVDAITTHDYQKAGDFNVTLVVTDDAGTRG